MIKILLVAEGVNDRGSRRYNPKKGINEQGEGALQPLIRNCAQYIWQIRIEDAQSNLKEPQAEEMEFVVKNRKELHTTRLPKKPQRLTRNQVEEEQLYRAAYLNRCNHVAYHMDEDNHGFTSRYEHVVSHLKVCAEHGIKCLPIVPCHMTESWLLSDEAAFVKAFGQKPNALALPTRPEECWGAKDDPSSNRPKYLLERVLESYGVPADTQHYRELAEYTQVETALGACPLSYGKFYEDMESFI